MEDFEYIDDESGFDGVFSEARGKKRRKKPKRKKAGVKFKKPVNRFKKPARVPVIKRTSASNASFKNRVLKALDGDEFYNADGGNEPSVAFGI